MHAFYFGSSARPLYGVYHPPKGESQRDAGVVLCYPFGQEYMRGHRAFRQLGLLLARAGFHVLRFDYFGTGDSGGASTDGSPAEWVDDVALAVEELQEMAEIERISLVGARLGALLALAAADRVDAIDSLVLWDPVLSGHEYAEALMRGASAASLQPAGTAHAVVAAADGFPITHRMRDELQAMSAQQVKPAAASTLVLVSQPDDAVEALVRDMAGEPASPIAYRHIPARGNWNEVDNFGSALLPQEIIQAVVRWLEERHA